MAVCIIQNKILMKKLITLSDFIEEIESYVSESFNIERGLDLIIYYKDFLKQPIKEEMFLGDKPLFPGFVKCNQKEATSKGYLKSFDNYGEEGFYMTIYKKYDNDRNPSWVLSFNLKTINDLIGKVEEFDNYNKNIIHLGL